MHSTICFVFVLYCFQIFLFDSDTQYVRSQNVRTVLRSSGSRTAEVGYYIAEPYWGQGIGTSAVKQLCEYVFQNTDIIRLFAEPFAHNAASCRILEKCGFELEGTLRKNAVKNGVVVDMKMYSILKE